MVLEKTLESPLDSKEIKPFNTKSNLSWIFTGRTDAEANTLATWCKEKTHWKRPWCWERLKAGGEGGIKGWDGLIPSLTQCANSVSLSKLQEMVKFREAWHATAHVVAKSRTWLSDWTMTAYITFPYFLYCSIQLTFKSINRRTENTLSYCLLKHRILFFKL